MYWYNRNVLSFLAPALGRYDFNRISDRHVISISNEQSRWRSAEVYGRTDRRLNLHLIKKEEWVVGADRLLLMPRHNQKAQPTTKAKGATELAILLQSGIHRLNSIIVRSNYTSVTSEFQNVHRKNRYRRSFARLFPRIAAEKSSIRHARNNNNNPENIT